MEKIRKYICENCGVTWHKNYYLNNNVFSEGCCCPNCESKNVIAVESKESNYHIYEKNIKPMS